MKSVKPKTTIIILNWNGVDFLKQNLSSVFALDYDNLDVLVVDNASKDNSVEYLEEYKKTESEKRLNILQLNKNEGFTGGNNRGVEWVIQKGKSKYVVFLNNDVKVEKDWLSHLIAGFDKDDIGICTSKMYLYYPFQQVNIVSQEDTELKRLDADIKDYHMLEYPKGFDKQGKLLTLPKKLESGNIYKFAVPVKRKGDAASIRIKTKGGKLKIFSGDEKFELDGSGEIKMSKDAGWVIQSAGSVFEKKRMNFVERHLLEFDKPLQSQIVDGGCGGAMAVRLDLLERLGAFKESYFAYFEDSELSYRLAREGFKTKFVADAVCYHWFWGSSGTKESPFQVFYMVRNRLWFIREYFGIIKYTYFTLRSFTRVILFILSIPLKSRASFFSRYYLKGTVASLRNFS